MLGQPLPALAAAAKPPAYAHILHCEDELPPAPPHTHNAVADINASGVIYAFGKLHHHFSLTAELTLPKVPQNHGLFYANWLMLIPLVSAKQQFSVPFVQINFMRWSRYHYRPEVAYTWAGPDGKLIYADSSTFIDGRRPHTFGIAVDGPRISMSVDGHQVCHGRTADFFDFRRPLYYQIGDEVAYYGDRIGGTVTNIRLRSDGQTRPHPYAVTCMYHDRGVGWVQTSPGTFRGEGALDKTKPSGSTGATPNSLCRVTQ
jgi:hypothetical protein